MMFKSNMSYCCTSMWIWQSIAWHCCSTTLACLPKVPSCISPTHADIIIHNIIMLNWSRCEFCGRNRCCRCILCPKSCFLCPIKQLGLSQLLKVQTTLHGHCNVLLNITEVVKPFWQCRKGHSNGSHSVGHCEPMLVCFIWLCWWDVLVWDDLSQFNNEHGDNN